MDDGTAPAPKPDMMEQLKRMLERYSNGDDLARRFPNPERDSTLVLASAVVAVVAELRDIHNVLHEINGHIGTMAGLQYQVAAAQYGGGVDSFEAMEVYE